MNSLQKQPHDDTWGNLNNNFLLGNNIMILQENVLRKRHMLMYLRVQLTQMSRDRKKKDKANIENINDESRWIYMVVHCAILQLFIHLKSVTIKSWGKKEYSKKKHIYWEPTM